MKRIVFGECVQGASHKRADLECQDSYKKIEFDDGTVIMAVADGHGSKSSPYSKTGSTVAVNVFCKVMKNFYDSYAEDTEMLLTYLNREGDTKVAQAVDSEWKRRILKVHADRKREVPLNKDGEKDKPEIYKLYGSTLVGLMITPTFLFAFQHMNKIENGTKSPSIDLLTRWLLTLKLHRLYAGFSPMLLQVNPPVRLPES